MRNPKTVFMSTRCDTHFSVLQVITTLALSMNHLVMGVSVAFAGVFTEQLTSPDAQLKLNVFEISWICSITSVGNMIGYLISSYVNPK